MLRVTSRPGYGGDHHLIIEGTTVDIDLVEGAEEGPFEITFDEVGTFKVYCTLHTECVGGEIVVME